MGEESERVDEAEDRLNVFNGYQQHFSYRLPEASSHYHKQSSA